MHLSLLLLPGSLAFLAGLPLACPTLYTGGKKPQTCPDILQNPDQAELRGNYCQDDSSCPGSQKCCKTKHGQLCVLPEGVLSGYCPKLALEDPDAATCTAECNDDYDCLGYQPSQKCCDLGPWRLCMESDKEHPGVCPLREVVQTCDPCNNTCDDDRDCSITQKCCFDGCSRSCLDPVRSHQCRLPPERGPCKASLTHYYYDVGRKACVKFTYGGCGGNSNNFETKEECEKTCGKINPEVCKQHPDSGPCSNCIERYYYNSTSNTCRPFTYGGCKGNDNRFQSELECLIVCKKPDHCIVK
ncbi:uncharacterized protein LOC143836618 [Paroedura picta]|uniref:uncharacterized protein LOC143836618 n=1 Tax=Paroedura picta TaxID=143630 RepID=UPI00405699E2